MRLAEAIEWCEDFDHYNPEVWIRLERVSDDWSAEVVNQSCCGEYDVPFVSSNYLPTFVAAVSQLAFNVAALETKPWRDS